MKAEQLKLYNKYKDINNPEKELIYIGINDNYWFLYKNEKVKLLFLLLKHYNFDPDKIAKDLNLETFIDKYGGKHIKGYDWFIYPKEYIEKYVKPNLKDKLNNILNR